VCCERREDCANELQLSVQRKLTVLLACCNEMWRVCTLLNWFRIGFTCGLSEQAVNLKVLRDLAISYSAERLLLQKDPAPQWS
jgi:hypothetical protein